MTNPLTQLHRLIANRYNLDELRTLCMYLGVDYESLPGEGKAGKARELLLRMGRKRQLDQLLVTLARSRPDLSGEIVLKADTEALYAALPSFEDASLPAAPAPGEPPFKGMQYFDRADAHLFFGRERLVAQLVGRLRQNRFLAVVGASGSGKSSVVRAGLVPALKRGADVPLVDGAFPPDGSSHWPLHVITPTHHPLQALAASLTRDSESVTATATLMDDLARAPRSLHLYALKTLSKGGEAHLGDRLLLIVDQFEELFTLCRSEDERRAFVDNLLTAVSFETDGPTVLVIVLRADFYAHCGGFEGLREALARYQEYIGQMKREELQRAIEEPAQQEGWEFEPGLVDLLLRDVGSEPGRLPLLSHALLETWKRRQGRALTLGGYHEAGGVRGAIARTAETVFQRRLTPEQQPIARNIFLRLTELGEGTQDTRRRVTPVELVSRPENAPSVQAVLKILADARLVTTGEDAVQVAHEALIREWPALRRWLDEDREGLRIHRHLTKSAQGWIELDRDSGELYRGARLAQALEWVEDHADELNDLEREFFDASRAVGDAVRERELRIRVASLTTGLIHDINSAVATIPDLAIEIEEKLQSGEDIEAPLVDLRKSALEADMISGRLRDFVIIGQFNSQLVRLGPLIQKAINASQDQKPEHVTIYCQMNNLNPEIVADGLWIELLVQNLVLNALDAIPADQEGLVEIEVEVDPNNVYIRITDNGIGIADKDLSHLFEPGYTTKKDRGRLRGIGLYHCLQVVQEHQGDLQVRSTPGVGTVFTAILPRASSSTASGKE